MRYLTKTIAFDIPDKAGIMHEPISQIFGFKLHYIQNGYNAFKDILEIRVVFEYLRRFMVESIEIFIELIFE